MRDRQLNVRLHPEEYCKAKAAAARKGLSVAAYVRMVCAGLTLHEAQSACRVQTNQVGADTDSAITELEARVAKMRALGVTRWGDIELGPAPTSGSPEEDATQRSDMLDRKSQEDAKRARRLKFGASGGPRPAVAPHR